MTGGDVQCKLDASLDDRESTAAQTHDRTVVETVVTSATSTLPNRVQ